MLDDAIRDRKVFPEFKELFQKNPEILFLGIPKTGSTYVDRIFQDNGYWRWAERPFHDKPIMKFTGRYHSPGHGVFTLNDDIRILGEAIRTHENKWGPECKRHKNVVTFSVIRNPFDYFVSYIYHGAEGYGSVRRYYKFKHDYFENIVKHYCDENQEWHYPPAKKFLFFHIFRDTGNCGTHFLIRNEHLPDGMRLFSEAAGLNLKISDKRVNITAHRSRNKGHDYRNFYTPELRKMFEKKCARELEMFGYDFDGPIDDRIILDSRKMRYLA